MNDFNPKKVMLVVGTILAILLGNILIQALPLLFDMVVLAVWVSAAMFVGWQARGWITG